MSIKIMSWVWDNSPYEGKALLVHLALADWAGDHGVCWPNQESIAKKARCSVETVRTTVRSMERDGFLEIIQQSRGRGDSTRYQLKSPKPLGPNDLGLSENPQIDGPKPPNPSPKNRQEPSINTKCAYCNVKLTPGKAHNCSAMNMRIG